ncbi:hypothetical protein [Bradyrhizobium genomosp. III]|uniref:hypothetical protein n=1 Tax=Bradyrhizobium genomosp. III TaxID=2683271 RepID=UPI0012F4CC88|nr:hypothetical protein [Bradyrhizobium sp. CCBAU 15635]
MAFDFRSQAAGAGAAIQALLLLLFLGLSALFWLSSRPIRKIRPSLTLAGVVAWFCLESAFVGYLDRQEIYSIIVNIVPIGLLVLTNYNMQRAIACAPDLTSLLTCVKWLAVLFLFARVVVIAATTGIDITTARYEILAGSVNACLGLLATSILYGLSGIDLLILTTTLALVAISVTRSQIAVAISQFGIYLSSISYLFKNPKTLRRLALLVFLPLGLVAADQLGQFGITDRWIVRLFAASEFGVDPTLIARNAEVEFMLDAFTASSAEFMFGHGIAAETSLIGGNAAAAAAAVGRDSIANVHSKGFGHHNYWSILFVGGVLGGLPLLVFLCHQTVEAALFFRRVRVARLLETTVAQFGLWGSATVIGMSMFGFLAGTFGDRPTCLWYGIGMGMLAAARGLVGRLAHDAHRTAKSPT